MRLTRESGIGIAIGVALTIIGAVIGGRLPDWSPDRVGPIGFIDRAHEAVWNQAASVAGKRSRKLSPGLVVRMRVTAYCSCERCCNKPRNHPAYGLTASGHRVTDARCFVAADPSIPFGTMIAIPGYNGGQAVPVWDRGGAIKGDKIDVYYEDHASARRWGVRHLDCVI